MLLLDEMNQYASKDASDQVFDLLRITDKLTNTTRGQMQVKQAQRYWELFRKRMRENYPKVQKPSQATEDQAKSGSQQLPPEPEYINALRNKLISEQTLTSTIKNRFSKRLKRYDSLQVQSETWLSKESSVSNLVTQFTEHIQQGRTL